MKSRWIILICLVLLGSLVSLSCSVGRSRLARVTPTPTKTPRPVFTATSTPTDTPTEVPTPIPTAVPPTSTPPPPTATPDPTDTLAPPTDTPVQPSDTPIPPTVTPVPPAETARPPATHTPAALAQTPTPQVDFRIAEVFAFEDGSLSASGLHNIYFTVLDASGAPINGIILEEVNNQPATQVVSGDKGPGKAEFTMWAADYKFRVAGNTSGQAFTSEVTHVLSVLFGHALWEDLIRGGICPDPASCEALGPIHYSYSVTFHRAW